MTRKAGCTVYLLFASGEFLKAVPWAIPEIRCTPLKKKEEMGIPNYPYFSLEISNFWSQGQGRHAISHKMLCFLVQNVVRVIPKVFTVFGIIKQEFQSFFFLF